MISVTITKQDDETFTVSSGEAMSESQGKPAPDLQSALLMAAKILSKPITETLSPFDQGLKSGLPSNGSMGNVPII